YILDTDFLIKAMNDGTLSFTTAYVQLQEIHLGDRLRHGQRASVDILGVVSLTTFSVSLTEYRGAAFLVCQSQTVQSQEHIVKDYADQNHDADNVHRRNAFRRNQDSARLVHSISISIFLISRNQSGPGK